VTRARVVAKKSEASSSDDDSSGHGRSKVSLTARAASCARLSGAAAESLIAATRPLLEAAGTSATAVGSPVLLPRPSGTGVVLGTPAIVSEVQEILHAYDAVIGQKSLEQMKDDLTVPEQQRLCLAHAAVEIKQAKRAWMLKVREQREEREALAEEMRGFAMSMLAQAKEAAAARSALGAETKEAAPKSPEEEEATDFVEDTLRQAPGGGGGGATQEGGRGGGGGGGAA